MTIGKKINNSYRDMLIGDIKSVGQQLIDRAEEMVGENTKYITDFNISIHIPSTTGEPNTISWTTETFDSSILEGDING